MRHRTGGRIKVPKRLVQCPQAAAQFANAYHPHPLRCTCSSGCLQRESYIPVPVRGTTCGLPPPSSLINTDPLRAPVAVGLKVTMIVQESPAPKVPPLTQVLPGETRKSTAFVPWIKNCHKFIVTAPLLVTVIVCGALLVFTVWLAKGRLVGNRLAAVPTPVRTTV